MSQSNSIKFDLLRQAPLFANVDDEFIEKLSVYTSILTRSKNTLIIQEGDLSDSFYLIESGQVKVYVSDVEGNEIIINYLGAGECFGELSFFDQKPRSASVMTIKLCQILSLPRPAFMQHLQEHPATAFGLFEVLTSKVRQQTLATKSLALEDVYERLVKLLLELGELRNGVIKIHGVNHQQLAERVFASRPMITRIINELEKKGHIKYARNLGLIEIIKTLPNKWR